MDSGVSFRKRWRERCSVERDAEGAYAVRREPLGLAKLFEELCSAAAVHGG